MTFRRVLRAWDRFLFEPVSPVPLGVYRACLGALVLTGALVLVTEANNLYTETGILPLADALKYAPPPRIDVLALLPPGLGWVYVFFGVFLVAALCLTVGFMTRSANVLVFVGLASLHHRNPVILNGGDTILRLSSFYLMFAPAGAAFSVDRWLRVRRHAEPAGPPAPVAPWAQRLIQMQLALAYLATVHWKLAGHTWVDGTAVYYATRLREFDRFPVPFLFEYRPALRLMTWGTLVLEFSLATLVWFRDLRYPVLLAGLLLHVGLDYSMNIPLFQWTMLSIYVLFIDPRDLRRAAEWLARWRARRRRERAPAPAVAAGAASR